MQLGPLSTEELSAKARGGEVSPSDLVWKEGMPDWKPLAQVPEFQSTGGLSNPPPLGMGSVPMQQPPMYPAGYIPGSVPNYLWQSIVVTVLCCLPFGVVSIIHAAKVDSLLAQGDIVGANAASQSAKKWAIAGAVSWGVLVVVPFAVFFIIGAGTAIFAPTPAP
jgi:hypothetical protein